MGLNSAFKGLKWQYALYNFGDSLRTF